MALPSRWWTVAIAALALSGCDRGECEDGDSQSRACGDCGVAERACRDGAWGGWTGCDDEGVCTPGDLAAEACGRDLGPCELGERQRSCTDACAWDAWSDCAGGVQPQAELCGDTVDNNCNDEVDEFCTCSVVAEGEGGILTFSGFVVDMAADPNRCLVYVAAHDSAQVLVIDLDGKEPAGAVVLDVDPAGMAMSPDGQRLVLRHADSRTVSVVDTAMWTVEAVEVAQVPGTLALADDGGLFYADGTGGQVRWVDVDRGGLTEQVAFVSGKRVVDLAVHDDRLYVGQGNPRELAVHDLAPPHDRLDASTAELVWPVFQNMRRVRPWDGGVYFAGSVFDADDLAEPFAVMDQPLHALARSGTVGVGSDDLWDLQIGRPVAGLVAFAECAAVALDGEEVWTGWGEMLWFNALDPMLQDARLGEADPDALPLSSYLLQNPLHDPVRDRLYGVDPVLWALVAVDLDGLVPLVERPLRSPPSMFGRDLLTITPDGDTLYFADFVSQRVVAYDPVTLAQTGQFDLGGYPKQIVSLQDDWMAVVTEDEELLLVDAATGAEADRFAALLWQPSAATSADGSVLFLAEKGIEPAFVRRMGFESGEWVEEEFVSRQDYEQESVRALPDGSAVFHGEALMEGDDLALRYTLPAVVVAVSGDSRLAFTAESVYRVSDGQSLGALPATAAEPAPSPDGALLYLAQDGGIVVVDLSNY